MFTELHRQLILEALDAKVSGNNRTKAKQPRFASVVDKEIELIRETQRIVREWATQSPEDTKSKK